MRITAGQEGRRSAVGGATENRTRSISGPWSLPRLTHTRMIGAWCRASGYLFAVADTPEELSKLIGMTPRRIRECMDSKGSRGASAADIGGAKNGWVIKTIAR